MPHKTQSLLLRLLSPLVIVAALCLLTTGCKVGPDFHAPQTQMPDNWIGSAASAEAQQPSPAARDLAHWWAVFNDPVLSSLVDRAVESNLDLKQAEVRIRQARASRGIALSGLGPIVDATASYTRSRTPVETPKGVKGVIASHYQEGLDATWEADIFGGVRRNVEAADADLRAALEDRSSVLVTLVAEVALDYVDLRAFQQQIAVAKKNLKSQKHTADLTRQRFPAFASGLDVANASAQVATTTAQIPVLETSAQQMIYSIALLLGRQPDELLDELLPTGDIPAASPAVPLGVPSELLRRRPDIRRVEEQIHAATARIGVATADLYPKLTLSASGGLEGSNSGALHEWASRFWSFGSSVTWRLFASGEIRSNIELQKALTEATLFSYQATVLTALQDVENALIASTKEDERRKALEQAVDQNQKAVKLSLELYTQGLTDFLSVLDAQRSLYATEDTSPRSRRNISTDLVALYKALGGGWESGQGEASMKEE